MKYTKYLLLIGLYFSLASTVDAVSMFGTASYYSRAGCLGCSKTLTMANGQTLDDTKLTLAMVPSTVRKYKLLNKIVKITNPKTKKTIYARVTDTGGFARYSRIADLSLASKVALGCTDLCKVNISF